MALTTLLVLCVAEVLSFFTLYSSEHDIHFERLRTKQSLIAASGVRSVQDANETLEIVHPYLGWVFNPRVHPGIHYGNRLIPVNELGFVDDKDSVQRRSKQRVIIGICGGSIAWQFSVDAEAALRAELQRNPRFHDKKIVIVRLAMHGYKQPQPLFALNYVLALGAEFDIVLNIDGYNEVALHPWENGPAGVFYAFPRGWHVRSLELTDPAQLTSAYQMIEMARTRQEWARDFAGHFYRYSPTLTLLWRQRDHLLERKKNVVVKEFMHGETSRKPGYRGTGPNRNAKDEQQQFEDLVALWRLSSRQIHSVCRGNNIDYVHVLPPNQYYTKFRPKNLESLRNVIDPDLEYGHAAAKGYPLLVRDGKRLLREGIHFRDLTALFADVTEPVYSDKFCHFNKLGNRLLAHAIAKTMIDSEGVSKNRTVAAPKPRR